MLQWQMAVWAVLWYITACFGLQYGPFCRPKRAVLQSAVRQAVAPCAARGVVVAQRRRGREVAAVGVGRRAFPPLQTVGKSFFQAMAVLFVAKNSYLCPVGHC